jgi:hypothetical protein
MAVAVLKEASEDETRNLRAVDLYLDQQSIDTTTPMARRALVKSCRPYRGSRGCRISDYLPSFQMSAASLQSAPTASQTTTYLPVTSCGGEPFVFRLKVPISRAAEGPSGFTSRVVTFGSPTCSARPFHIVPIAVLPFTMAEPGGNAVASSVYSDATPAKSPLLKKSTHFSGCR